MARVLVVDDDPACAEYMALALELAGHEVSTMPNGIAAMLAIEDVLPDAVVTDLEMPELGGLELVSRVHERWPGLPVAVISVQSDAAVIVDAVKRGAVNYLVKPCPPERIQDVVQKMVALSARPRSPAQRVAPEIVGRSRAMVDLRHQVVLAAGSDANVLITGETGTGKELAARAVHRCSSLADKPFVPHNCAVTPSGLFESMFFGHVKGAFTGADKNQLGLFVEADGGVLFLDELETLSLEQQAKLLRVLDDGEVRAVGATQSRQVCVRFFAATNRDPAAMVREGLLREDLYYRLRGFELELVPLVHRLDDLPLLVDHFLRDRDVAMTPDAMQALCAHSWPGNVRELKNVLKSAIALAGDRPIDRPHLNLEARDLARWRARIPQPSAAPVRTLREVEIETIQRALDACGNNRSRAAEMLGIDRSTLRRKLDETRADPDGTFERP